MLWCYDNAIVKDLENCLSAESGAGPHVVAADPQVAVGIMAQLQEDKVTLPFLCLMRDDTYEIDEVRSNFTRLHKGVETVFDPGTNNIYLEKSIPINLSYTLHVLTSNTADMDEMIRELLFRYASMYFITMEVPYESKRKIRFGISIPPGTTIQRQSGAAEFLQEGKIYESTLPLKCEGAVLLSYTPKHMERVDTASYTNLEVVPATPTTLHRL